MANFTKRIALALALVAAQPQFANASLPPADHMPANLLPLSMRVPTSQPTSSADPVTRLEQKTPVAQSLLDWESLNAAANMNAVLLDSNDFMPDGTSYDELDSNGQKEAMATFTDWLGRNAPQFMRMLESTGATQEEVTELFDNALTTMAGMQGQGAFSIGNATHAFCFLDVSAETQASPTLAEGIDTLLRAADGCNANLLPFKMFGHAGFKPMVITHAFGIARANGVTEAALGDYITNALMRRPEGPAMFVTYYASLLGVNDLGAEPRLAKALETRTQRVLDTLTKTPANARFAMMLRTATGPKGIEAAFAHAWLGNIAESAFKGKRYDRARDISRFVNQRDGLVQKAPVTPVRLAPKR